MCSTPPRAAPRHSPHPARADCTRQPEPPLSDGTARDDRAWIVFDVNGTIASDSKRRRSVHRGGIAARPHLKALARLRPTFRIALYSSMQTQNMARAVELVEGVHGINAPLDAILHRTSNGGCSPAPRPRKKEWSTVKPLDVFRDTVRGGLSRVVLVDDSAEKVVSGQEANLLLVPAWEEQEEDRTLQLLVDALLAAEVTEDAGAADRADAGVCAGSDASIDGVAAALDQMAIAPTPDRSDLRLHLATISANLFIEYRGASAGAGAGGGDCVPSPARRARGGGRGRRSSHGKARGVPVVERRGRGSGRGRSSSPSSAARAGTERTAPLSAASPAWLPPPKT